MKGRYITPQHNLSELLHIYSLYNQINISARIYIEALALLGSNDDNKTPLQAKCFRS